MGLSTIVGAVALVPAGLAYSLHNLVPASVTAVLTHVAACGFAVALAASSPAAPYTTWLLQKDQQGSISLLSHVLYWPYHLALRTKLWVQRRVSVEPLYNKITPEL
jgi:hypothetical protein